MSKAVFNKNLPKHFECVIVAGAGEYTAEKASNIADAGKDTFEAAKHKSEHVKDKLGEQRQRDAEL